VAYAPGSQRAEKINHIMNIPETAIGIGAPGKILTEDEIRDVAARAQPIEDSRGKKLLLNTLDGTRTARSGELFKTFFHLIGNEVEKPDVMIALGTHQPMSDEAINARLEITAEERATKYSNVEMINHAWDDPDALVSVGEISADEIAEI